MVYVVNLLPTGLNQLSLKNGITEFRIDLTELSGPAISLNCSRKGSNLTRKPGFFLNLTKSTKWSKGNHANIPMSGTCYGGSE